MTIIENPTPSLRSSGSEPRAMKGLVLLLDVLGTERERSQPEWLDFLARRLKLLGVARKINPGSITMVQPLSPTVVTSTSYPFVAYAAGFSDTIAVCVETSMPGREALFMVADGLKSLFLSGLRQQELLRGSLVFGDFYRDSEIVAGPALVDAARAFESAEWAGVTLNPVGGTPLDGPGIPDYNNHFEKWMLPVRLERHSETLTPVEHWTLAWPNANGGLFFNEGLDRTGLEDHVSGLFDSADTSVQRKRVNTLAYMRDMSTRQRERWKAYLPGGPSSARL
jgi:hypothetical protein